MGLDRKTKQKMLTSGIVSVVIATIIISGVITQYPLEQIGDWEPIIDDGTINNTTSLLFTIPGATQTSFGTYYPFSSEIIPKITPSTISSDLANIENLDQFRLNDGMRQKLVANGFVAVPTMLEQIYDVYKTNEENYIPNFVTTDSVLHAYHILYDYALRMMEVQTFSQDLEHLSETLLDLSEIQHFTTSHSEIGEAAKKNTAFFAVALKLQNPKKEVPLFVADSVAEELALIKNHEGFTFSPIFGYREDYSQYVARGHYSRNEVLEHYFLTMLWYGRIMFRLEPGSTPQEIESGKQETRQALLILLAINNAQIDGNSAIDIWERIYEPTAFFVGKTDDLNLYDYQQLAENVYGSDFQLADLTDDAKLEEFIAQAKNLTGPKINSAFVYDYQNFTEITKGFRFMGQRFVPDSYMFQELVYDKVGTMAHARLFPKSLDILSVLGSKRAEALLESEKQFANYETQINKLQKEFVSLNETDWTQSLYWLWLYSLLPLLNVKGEGYPSFMQTSGWVDKELHTALGSWTELRHDTILYAKQSYTLLKGAAFPPNEEPAPKGFVEPNPALYGRLASLTRMMQDGLASRQLLHAVFGDKLARLEALLLTLKEISEKELTNRDLSEREYEEIRSIGATLEELTTFPAELANELTSETDTSMAIIADVHTDPNTRQVLEEGVGNVLEIYVIVEVAGQLQLTSGGMFSYYEFVSPMSDRLTDESWQALLKAANEPTLPDWTETFIVQSEEYDM